MASKAPAVVDAILTVVRAAAGTIEVADGPIVSGEYDETICIGYDGDPEGSGEAYSSDQDWIGLGAKHRDETIRVNCAIHLALGDAGVGTVKAARDRAHVLLGIVEDAIHPAPSIGLSPPCWAGITSHRMLPILSAAVGLEAWIPFVITCRTRI